LARQWFVGALKGKLNIFEAVALDLMKAQHFNESNMQHEHHLCVKSL
jgi:hypothetical protein